MEWFWFIIIAALLGSVAQLARKRALFHEHAMTFTSFRGYITMFWLLVLAFFVPLSLSLNDALYLFILASLVTLGIILTAHAVRHSNISDISPLSGLNAVFTLLLGIFFLTEVPTMFQALGIGVCVVGVYLLKFDHKSILGPFKKLTRALPRQFMFGIFLFSLATVGSREIVQRVDPLTVVWYSFLFVSVQIILIEWIFFGLRDIKEFKKEPYSLIIAATFMLAANFFVYYGLSFPEAQAALVRTLLGSGMLVVTFVGGFMYHEGGLLRKSLAALVILSGSLLLVL